MADEATRAESVALRVVDLAERGNVRGALDLLATEGDPAGAADARAALAGMSAHPLCTACGQRIGLHEWLWRELASGTVRAAYSMDLGNLVHDARGLWHPGCLPPERHPPR